MFTLWSGSLDPARSRSNWPHNPRGSTDAFHGALCYLPVTMARPQSRASAEESYFWIGVRALPLIVRIAIFASACVVAAVAAYVIAFWLVGAAISPIVDPIVDPPLRALARLFDGIEHGTGLKDAMGLAMFFGLIWFGVWYYRVTRAKADAERRDKLRQDVDDFLRKLPPLRWSPRGRRL